MDKKLTSIPIVFIAFQEQDNLGVGYLCSTLIDAGYDVRLIDFRNNKKYISDSIKLYNPLIVGFSLIFQYHLSNFQQLIEYLRNTGIESHFVVGGHYPSLRYDDLLRSIPQIDSIVRFEGETTFLELVNHIYGGNDWHHLKSVAYRENHSIISNSLRPLEKDLDNFLPPARPPLKEYVLGKKYATILAGRGCYYDCSFCSIRKFYSEPPGPLKRIRAPGNVSREMELLFAESNCSVFMFQDDDFPVGKKAGKKWISSFCKNLLEKKLIEKIIWKINCRPDEIDFETFKYMKECGLFLVYLGIESGTNLGLQRFNKHLTIEEILDAVNILKHLDIAFDYGFMLFDPWSNYESILQNLLFLEKIVEDGSSPITYCKMLPYAETEVEKILKEEHRLINLGSYEDYKFLDAPTNNLYNFFVECFQHWIGEHEGVLNLARWAKYHFLVFRKFIGDSPKLHEIEKSIKDVISDSNKFFISVALTLMDIFYSEKSYIEQNSLLDRIKETVHSEHHKYQIRLNGIIKQIQSNAK